MEVHKINNSAVRNVDPVTENLSRYITIFLLSYGVALECSEFVILPCKYDNTPGCQCPLRITEKSQNCIQTDFSASRYK
jgi:hypothetical protein